MDKSVPAGCGRHGAVLRRENGVWRSRRLFTSPAAIAAFQRITPGRPGTGLSALLRLMV